MGMFLSEAGTAIQYLAPVQGTGFMTGIVGSPTGTDANGRAPGGGGVTSFAFSSNPTAVAGTEVTVSQSRQLALTDIVGISSAAFADTLQNQFAIWEQDPAQFLELLVELAEDVWEWLEGRLGEHGLAASHAFIAAPPRLKTVEDFMALKLDLGTLKDLIPRYQYWPVANAAPYPQTNPTRFADGGSLENSGVNAMLSYTDVENVIAFLNSSTAMAAARFGMIDPSGNEVPGTRVVITEDIPPLFGYQPYSPLKGYVLYEGDPNPVFPQGKNSQVFESSLLAEVIQGLWAASGSGANAGSAIYKQTLEVQDNAWFGVRGRAYGERPLGLPEPRPGLVQPVEPRGPGAAGAVRQPVDRRLLPALQHAGDRPDPDADQPARQLHGLDGGLPGRRAAVPGDV